MQPLPDVIDTTDQLQEVLSRPSDALVEFIRTLDGDVMILGVGGKIGPTMARMVHRAAQAAGAKKPLIAVARRPVPALAAEGIETLTCDLLDPAAVRKLPAVENIIYLVGRKFGSTGNEPLTWATNVIAPYHVAQVFSGSRIVAFSTGCVYPIMDVKTGGATEETPAEPVGEYAMSCLGRERMFDHFSQTRGLRVVHLRLNYAAELRYGVLVDVATNVFNGRAVDLTTGFANVIWQGDACDKAIRALVLADSPPRILNVTGPEIISIRDVARQFARLFGTDAIFAGREKGRGYLSNAATADALLGGPTVTLDRLIQWTAHWITGCGENLGKPTHFETQNGKY